MKQYSNYLTNMPEDSKKTNDKKKHEPKDQRKPRHSRNQAGKSERKADKVEETKSEHKVFKKPVYEEPGPEFYKNLKRETDEIVKITEAENAKYKKKEIQSNWAKYEMPLENYEEVDEHDVGADYEKLIQVPLSAGGHFQFKHEKSWDTSTAPTLYNKYFEINMDNLSTAISTIPFYDRNDINQSEFSETDMLGMNTRASKYKSKYFNDKSFSVETTAQETILKSMREKVKCKEITDATETPIEEVTETDDRSDKYDINLDFNVPKTSSDSSVQSDLVKQDIKSSTGNAIDNFDDFIFKNVPDETNNMTEAFDKANLIKVITAPKHTEALQAILVSKDVPEHKDAVPRGPPVDATVNSVIQSPEELEKWLDDFLDS